MKKCLTGIGMCFVILALAMVFILVIKNTSQPKQYHFSIDDATMIFQDIAYRDYDSIFENPILARLKEEHDNYNLKVTFYVYAEFNGFSMADFPDKYKAEFMDNADWLHIGFHSISEENPENGQGENEDFKAAFLQVNQAIERFAGKDCVTNILRLHFWYADEEMKKVLKDNGVYGLLCSDKGKNSYNLSERENELLYESKNGIFKSDFMYYVTDVRLEDVDDIEEFLEALKGDKTIIIFTHAWCFEENADKLDEALQWLQEAGYQPSFLGKEQ